MATRVQRRRPSNRGKRARVDWGVARAYFAKLGATRTFAAVAKEFGVTETAVRKHAGPEGWEQFAAELDRRTVAKAEEKAERSLERTRTDALKIGGDLLGALSKHIDDVKPSDYQGVVKTMLLLHGEATDVIGIAEAADQTRAMLQLIKPFVPEEQWPAVLDALEKTMGEAA